MNLSNVGKPRGCPTAESTKKECYSGQPGRNEHARQTSFICGFYSPIPVHFTLVVLKLRLGTAAITPWTWLWPVVIGRAHRTVTSGQEKKKSKTKGCGLCMEDAAAKTTALARPIRICPLGQAKEERGFTASEERALVGGVFFCSRRSRYGGRRSLLFAAAPFGSRAERRRLRLFLLLFLLPRRTPLGLRIISENRSRVWLHTLAQPRGTASAAIKDPPTRTACYCVSGEGRVMPGSDFSTLKEKTITRHWEIRSIQRPKRQWGSDVVNDAEGLIPYKSLMGIYITE